MDIYIIICFFAVFAALVEFACINFIDTFIKRFRAWEEEEKKRLEKVEEEKKLLLETSLDEGNREGQDGEDHLKEVVREKAAELFDELVVVDTANGRMVVNQVLDTEDQLMVVHPENGKESVHFNFKADTADLFFIDHRYVVVANKSETCFQLFPSGWSHQSPRHLPRCQQWMRVYLQKMKTSMTLKTMRKRKIRKRKRPCLGKTDVSTFASLQELLKNSSLFLQKDSFANTRQGLTSK